jgi:hypothetical protein
VNLSSNSDDWTLLNVQNTGGQNKTLINVSDTNLWSTGINLNMSGQQGIVSSVYTTNNYWANGIASYVYESSNGIAHGVISNTGGGVYNLSYAGNAGSDDNNTTNWGLELVAHGGANSVNYAIDATAYGGDSSCNYAAYLGGDVVVTGSPWYMSDERLKTNIRGLGGGLSKVMALRPKTYEMRTNEFKNSISLPSGTQYGFIAQDVQTVLPEMVHEIAVPPRFSKADLQSPKKGEKRQITRPAVQKYMALNYTALIPVMLEAMQEQQSIIDSMRTEISVLKAGR